MKKCTVFIVLILISFSNLTYSKDKTDKERLLELSEEYRISAEIEKQQAIQKAVEAGIPIRYETSDSALVELIAWPDGEIPKYYITNNANAAITISVDKVYTGGGAGYSLSGTGVLLGEWDGGSARPTHQEFNNTGSSRVIVKDGATEHYHACHVGGTMVAGGVLSSAKGMSFAGSLHSYDWNSDFSEMATAAANNNLRVSNHSYGYIVGWFYNSDNSTWYWYGNPSYSTTEDHNFGLYSTDTQSADELAYSAPHYLICKSAGNDRNDNPGAGINHKVWDYTNGGWFNSSVTREGDGGADGYDCIGTVGSAKNILTVGAVNDVTNGYNYPSDVVMSSFSGWGPTDDGRIKPDIVANGVSLYSVYSGSNSAYTSMSGTSMSTPNASGAIGLILEHRRNLVGTGNDYLSSTIKGLICHTADEAGLHDGPDYSYGWGLMNTRACVDLMTENNKLGYDFYIQEDSLSNGEERVFIAESEGIEPIKVTICWTDPKGTPVTTNLLNNRTAMLVNDLDITIFDGTNTYQAWKLDVNNPSNAATKGDNDIDNVEQVYIKNPPQGKYTITINHDGTLANPQDYSIFISGLTQDVTSPKHLSEDISVYPEIKWNSIDDAVKYQLQVSTDNQFISNTVDTLSEKITHEIFTALIPNTKYYWRVRGQKMNGTYTAWENVYEFTTANNLKLVEVNLIMRLEGKWNGQTHEITPAIVQVRSNTVLANSVVISERGGMIDSNGNLSVDFDDIANGTYNLVVYVNGYLPQAISTPQLMTVGQQFNWDFTTIATKTYMSNDVLINENGIYLLKVGDMNGDFKVDNDDNNIFRKFGGKDYRSIFE